MMNDIEVAGVHIKAEVLAAMVAGSSLPLYISYYDK